MAMMMMMMSVILYHRKTGLYSANSGARAECDSEDDDPSTPPVRQMAKTSITAPESEAESDTKDGEDNQSRTGEAASLPQSATSSKSTSTKYSKSNKETDTKTVNELLCEMLSSLKTNVDKCTRIKPSCWCASRRSFDGHGGLVIKRQQ
ncbi:hypothetical protein BC937DRAFT_90387 [Endogone sp. FLAS-F59071]|nr:hypothetical protein BC937DRAFT_90387 [Endogone sp. FLAS-F59071]|eukprot:RUS17130.1 hypothetical protein BC937DRAFT_90387 [Endogone sp. FLAS-F59071]